LTTTTTPLFLLTVVFYRRIINAVNIGLPAIINNGRSKKKKKKKKKKKEEEEEEEERGNNIQRDRKETEEYLHFLSSFLPSPHCPSPVVSLYDFIQFLFFFCCTVVHSLLYLLSCSTLSSK